MNKQNCLSILSDLNCNEINLGLGPIKNLLEKIGNPQLMYPTVLIGGTNGKGSISAVLSSILKESGYKVGLYTSPHLINIRERIRINDTLISEERLHECIRLINSHLEEPLTYFEYLTASAYLYFYQEKVDIAVLEVGMGGRLDATNVVKPMLSVISNIHTDHQEYLGRHLKHIAREKAEIINDNNFCVTAVKQKAIINILENTCRERGATLLRLGKDIRVRSNGNGYFSYQGLSRKIANLYCSLSGAHQVKNAALALAAAELITARGIEVNEQAMITGVASATWEGRLEVLQKLPTVIVDGAHNLSAVTALCDELRKGDSASGRILILGVLRDKNYNMMLKKLLPLFQHIIFTKPKTDRAVDLDQLVKIAKKYGHFSEAIEDCREALQRALSLAGINDLICVSGSLYLVGEIKKIYAEEIFLKSCE
jgi:dihydrofolate synthase/folylpolyglutamate synthase